MPPWRQYRDTQELEQKSRQSLRSISMLALGQFCTLRIMPSGLHTPRNSQSPLHTRTVGARSIPHLASPCIMGAVCCLAVYAQAKSFKGAWPAGMQKALLGKLAVPDEGSIVLNSPHGGCLGDLQHIHGGCSHACIFTPALAFGRLAPVLHTSLPHVSCAYSSTSQDCQGLRAEMSRD